MQKKKKFDYSLKTTSNCFTLKHLTANLVYKKQQSYRNGMTCSIWDEAQVFSVQGNMQLKQLNTLLYKRTTLEYLSTVNYSKYKMPPLWDE